MAHRRWQIDLRSEDELTLARARRVLGAEGDSETGRALLALFAKLSAAVESGTVISFLPGDDPRAVDAMPEFTRALRPETGYRWLVAVPHPWRRQQSIKGRRITAGQLVDTMEANDRSVEAAAEDFDLPVEAVREAVDYEGRCVVIELKRGSTPVTLSPRRSTTSPGSLSFPTQKYAILPLGPRGSRSTKHTDAVSA